MIYRSHVIKLNPTYKQEQYFWRCVGAARKIYNRTLEEWQKRHAAGGKPTAFKLDKELNAVKKGELPWLLELPKRVAQQAVLDAGTAYQNYFNSLTGKRKGPKMGPPKFKSKHKSKPTSRLDNGPDTFSFEGKAVKLSKIGWVKTFEELRFGEGRPIGTKLSYQGGSWWLSVRVELPDPTKPIEVKPSVGIDFGIKTALALSDGKTFDAPKPLKANAGRERRLSKSLSRKVKGSNNWEKAKVKLAKFHRHVAQIRKDWQHKTTTAIAKQYGVVGLEDLNVKGMLKRRSIARSLSDIGFGELKRQLTYKCDKVVIINRWEPTSKRCSNCGCVKDVLALSERVFRCDQCGFTLDRDLNAAINIHTVSCTVNACGDGSSGLGLSQTKLLSAKQELDRTFTCTH